MNSEEWIDWLKKHFKIVIVLVLLIVVLIINAVFANVNTQSEEIEIITQTSEESVLEEETSSEPFYIFVDVKGEVLFPGVYQLENGQRIKDAIDMAGGFTAKAEQKNINLAQLATDQMMVYVPEIGEESISSQSTAAIEGEESELININTSDVASLMTLNGIGEKKAQAIIAYREDNGSFETIEDIMEVSGIGEKTFENLKEFITVVD